MWERDYTLYHALRSTLNSAWYGADVTADIVRAKAADAIDAYKVAYLQYVDDWVGAMWSEEGARSTPAVNKLSAALNAELSSRNMTLEQLAMDSSFTVDELTLLRNGELAGSRGDLNQLGDAVTKEYNNVRNDTIESLCTMLRGTQLSDTEKERFMNLLQPATRQSEPTLDTTSIMKFFKGEQ